MSLTSIEEIFTNKGYPAWIEEHNAFKKISYIRKIFPQIGLANFQEPILVDNSQEIKIFAKNLLVKCSNYLYDRFIKLEKFSKTAKKIGNKRRERIVSILTAIQTLKTSINCDPENCILKTKKGNIKLVINCDIKSKDQKVLFKKGTSLFKVYGKINELLKNNKLLPLADLTACFEYKSFSTINIPSKELLLKFSSDGKDGVWDIATMSMRGISSCQTWNGGYDNSIRVIGSMIDPFTAIIYLASPSNVDRYGTKMVRRCVVRYCIHRKTKSPFLLLEKMYPAFDKPSLDNFIKALKNKAPQLEIYFLNGMDTSASSALITNSYIPLSDEFKLLDANILPYRDSGLQYVEDKNFTFSRDDERLKKLAKEKAPTWFKKAISSSEFKISNVEQYGKKTSDVFRMLRRISTAKTQEPRDFTIKDLGEKFGNYICDLSKESNLKERLVCSKEYNQFLIDTLKVDGLKTDIFELLSRKIAANASKDLDV